MDVNIKSEPVKFFECVRVCVEYLTVRLCDHCPGPPLGSVHHNGSQWTFQDSGSNALSKSASVWS